ncbi:hypothetical protein PR048_022422 [Dryococelus australis]|uniref:Uncharacterized protein n=1 Tax=Dryococelus australis TaxID=614101 RepID=A0ABQ9H115_9NEOP|nr:hypothetical protein PR048_022422 [Dryococelus australis]
MTARGHNYCQGRCVTHQQEEEEWRSVAQDLCRSHLALCTEHLPPHVLFIASRRSSGEPRAQLHQELTPARCFQLGCSALHSANLCPLCGGQVVFVDGSGRGRGEEPFVVEGEVGIWRVGELVGGGAGNVDETELAARCLLKQQTRLPHIITLQAGAWIYRVIRNSTDQLREVILHEKVKGKHIQLATHLGELGSIPGGVARGFSHVGIVPDDNAGRRAFSEISRFPPPFNSGAAPYSPHFALIGSQSLRSPPLYSTLCSTFAVLNSRPSTAKRSGRDLKSTPTSYGRKKHSIVNTARERSRSCLHTQPQAIPGNVMFVRVACLQTTLTCKQQERLEAGRWPEIVNLNNFSYAYKVTGSRSEVKVNATGFQDARWVTSKHGGGRCLAIIPDAVVPESCDRNMALVSQKAPGETLEDWREAIVSASVKPNPFQVLKCTTDFFKARGIASEENYSTKYPSCKTSYYTTESRKHTRLYRSYNLQVLCGCIADYTPPTVVGVHCVCGIDCVYHIHDWEFIDEIDVQHVYTEVTFAIGSQLIRNALDDSEPIADLQMNKHRVPYCLVWSNTGYSLGQQPMNTQLRLLYTGLWRIAYSPARSGDGAFAACAKVALIAPALLVLKRGETRSRQLERSGRELSFGAKIIALATESREICYTEIFARDQNSRQLPRAPRPAPCARVAPTQYRVRILAVCRIERHHIVISVVNGKFHEFISGQKGFSREDQGVGGATSSGLDCEGWRCELVAEGVAKGEGGGDGVVRDASPCTLQPAATRGLGNKRNISREGGMNTRLVTIVLGVGEGVIATTSSCPRLHLSVLRPLTPTRTRREDAGRTVDIATD